MRGTTETDSNSTISYSIPVHADFLIAYSTVPGEPLELVEFSLSKHPWAVALKAQRRRSQADSGARLSGFSFMLFPLFLSHSLVAMNFKVMRRASFSFLCLPLPMESSFECFASPHDGVGKGQMFFLVCFNHSVISGSFTHELPFFSLRRILLVA